MANVMSSIVARCQIIDRLVADIEVTTVAEQMIRKLIDREANVTRVLRVEVTAGGCQGKKYLFNMVELTEQNIDHEQDAVLVASDNTAMIVIDKLSLGTIKGSTLDYVESIQWTGFVIVDNPQARSSCNCGASFA